MHIVLSRNGQKDNEYRFRRGPIYIGRQLGSQIFLQDTTVSRQHAVIFNTEHEWFIQDLDTPNKTFLNGNPIHKSHIKAGDLVAIGSYQLKIDFTQEPTATQAVSLEDTISGEMMYEAQTITRRIDREDSPAIKILPKRIDGLKDFCVAMCHVQTSTDFIDQIVASLRKQMSAAHVWLGIVEPVTHEIKYQFGKQTNTQKVIIDELVLKDHIIDAIRSCNYTLVPNMPVEIADQGYQSCLIVPVVSNHRAIACIYIDNTKETGRYGLPDLDYVILVAKLIQAKIERLRF